ncbi:zinc finger CCHC domain-containing protein 7-like [Liolophura sinensis]|uniref:zinc finger CCHC domain-containing protein 7-like n=1 Tax=Liolophura sinensis TaxID=3198878 RepID=UPI003158ED73
MDLQLNLSQESSTCEGDFKSPQGDGQDWSLIDEDMLSQGPASIPPRYYRPDRVKPLNIRCRNCNEVGHLSKICPRPKKHLICYLCGETGHNVRSCPTSICYNCEKAAGHTARDCPSSRKRLWEVCHRCQMQGHRQFECPELWRQYHVTTKGRLNKLKLKRNPRVYCHNCGGKGHFGFECTECQVNAHSPAVYPFIARYEEYKPHATDSTKRKDHRVFGNTGPSRKKQKLDDRSAGMTTELSDHVKHGTNPLAKFQSERRRKPNQDNNVESVHYVTDYSVTDNSVKSKKAADRRKSIKQKKKNKKAANHIPTDDQERGGLIKETLNSCKNVKNRKKKSKKKNKAVSGKTCAQTVVQTKRGFNIVLPNVKVKFQD